MRKHAISFSLLVKFSLTKMAESDQSYSVQSGSSIIPQLVSEIYIIPYQQVIKFVDNLFHIFITQITLHWQKNVILQLLFMDWIHGPMRYLPEVGSVYFAPTVCDNCIYTSYWICSFIYDIPISSQFSLRMPWTVFFYEGHKGLLYGFTIVSSYQYCFIVHC